MKIISQLAIACALLAGVGCSTDTTGSGSFYNLDGKGGDISLSFDGTQTVDDGSSLSDTSGQADGSGDGTASDGTPLKDSGNPIPDGITTFDSGPIFDSGPEVVDFDSFFDPDTGPDVQSSDITIGGGLSFVFAHSSDTLYRMDKSGFVKVGFFTFNQNPGSMTDIAMDKNGLLYGVTFDDLFKCDSKTAKCTWLASLPESFNGLTFVPAGTVKPADEALIGIANSGSWNLIEVTGTTAKVTKLGTYGSYSSSGDAFSVETIGTFATVKDPFSFGGTDILVEVDPKTGSVLKKIGDTGVSDIWGFAWFGGKFYGFSNDTNVYEVNTTTGKATASTAFKYPTGVNWWGAAVSTRAALD
jgi:hypothetical protein